MLTEEKIIDIVRQSEKRLTHIMKVEFRKINKRLGDVEQEIQGDIRSLGEGMYRRFDNIDHEIGSIRSDLDLRSQVGNEGFLLMYEGNKKEHKGITELLAKHHNRITTIERVMGNTKNI